MKSSLKRPRKWRTSAKIKSFLGAEADAVVTSVRKILGVNHEEEVRAPPERLGN